MARAATTVSTPTARWRRAALGATGALALTAGWLLAASDPGAAAPSTTPVAWDCQPMDPGMVPDGTTRLWVEAIGDGGDPSDPEHYVRSMGLGAQITGWVTGVQDGEYYITFNGAVAQTSPEGDLLDMMVSAASGGQPGWYYDGSTGTTTATMGGNASVPAYAGSPGIAATPGAGNGPGGAATASSGGAGGTYPGSDPGGDGQIWNSGLYSGEGGTSPSGYSSGGSGGAGYYGGGGGAGSSTSAPALPGGGGGGGWSYAAPGRFEIESAGLVADRSALPQAQAAEVSLYACTAFPPTYDGVLAQLAALGYECAPAPTHFAYTGSPESYTVPDDADVVIVDAFGAAGAGNGGLGGRAVGVVPVTPGETLAVRVGGAGFETSSGSESEPSGGGYNGGGGGYSDTDMRVYGGGGASDVRRGGDGLVDRIAVGGGGGGASDGERGGGGGGGGGRPGGGGGGGPSGGGAARILAFAETLAGGDGANPAGADSAAVVQEGPITGTTFPDDIGATGGGTAGPGVNGSITLDGVSYPGIAPALGTGGSAVAVAPGNLNASLVYPSGGGGGWYGGGAGGAYLDILLDGEGGYEASDASSGGAGGSSYVPPTGSAGLPLPVYENGVREGSGLVQITPCTLIPTTAPITTAPITTAPITTAPITTAPPVTLPATGASRLSAQLGAAAGALALGVGLVLVARRRGAHHR